MSEQTEGRRDPARLVRPEIRSMAGYVPGEQPRGRRYIKLNTNENPYPPSPRAIERARAAADEDLRLYPEPTADTLRERAAEVYGVRPDNLVVGNGSDELLAMILRACVSPGDRIAYPVPTYSLYDTLATIAGAVPVRVPFPPDFSLPDPLRAEAAAARVTFLCNPNSPSGTLVPLAAVSELAARAGGVLVVDEAYVDFAEETALELLGKYDNVIVLRTFSKSFSLAGLRVGLAFAHPELAAQLLKVKDSYNVNRVSLAAACGALEDMEWMRANVRRIQQTRAALSAALKARGWDVLPSHANFVFARRPGANQKATYLALRERGVLVRHFDAPGLGDGLRITVGTELEVRALLEALDAIGPEAGTESGG